MIRSLKKSCERMATERAAVATRRVFKDNCWSNLLSEFGDGDQISEEADKLVSTAARDFLLQLTLEACSAAERRESNVVTPDDIRFAADTVFGSETATEAPVPLDGHEERMEMLRQFRESLQD
jgi:histone H3/H4